MSRILLQNKHLTIVYFQDRNYLLLTWNGFIPGVEFRVLASEVLSAIERTKADSILSDNTNWKVINPNDHGWAASTWFPEAEKKGIRKLATILSNDYFNRMAEKNIEGMADVNCMQIRNFTSRENALHWLVATETTTCTDSAG